MINYIKKSILKESIERSIFKKIPVFVKDPFVEELNLGFVLAKVESVIPPELANNIDAIYIGQFDHLDKMEVNAAFHEGAIYVTNLQDDEEDMVDDIVHELAHSVEEVHGPEIYLDGQISREFTGKRKRLYGIIKSEGLKVEYRDFLNTEYDRNFDEMLYKEIGYPLLRTLTMGLFYSPYAITSLREYFANGFEAYFLRKDFSYLKKISPLLFDKLENLTQ
tara:strand:- start:84 stop:746 length:663 start_codon:yes stop_codon:yes gene_type:complete